MDAKGIFNRKVSQAQSAQQATWQAVDRATEERQKLATRLENVGPEVSPAYQRSLADQLAGIEQRLTVATEETGNLVGELTKVTSAAFNQFYSSPETTAQEYTPDLQPLKEIQDRVSEERVKMLALNRALDLN